MSLLQKNSLIVKDFYKKTNFEKNWRKEYFPEITETQDVWCFSVEEGTFNEIMYMSSLQGPHGVKIFLFPKKGTSKKEINKAKKIAKEERDVVSFCTTYLTE